MTPLYGIRRVLRTGIELLIDRQWQRLTAVFADERHVEVEAPEASTSASSLPTATPTARPQKPN